MGWTHTLKDLARAIGATTHQDGAQFDAVTTDTRTMKGGEVFFALKGERFDGNRFVGQAFEKGACAAVTTEVVAGGPCLVVKDPLIALQDFAAWHRCRLDIPVFAVTGSCGKTLSKDLVAAVLGSRYVVEKTQGNFNNEVGCPLSLLRLGPNTEIAVIEMGANHTGEIGHLCTLAKPTEASITLVAPAHLEGFGSIENVAKAKAEIVAALPPDGTFYLNADDEWCVKIGRSFPGRTVRFGRSGDVVLEACRFEAPGLMRLTVSPVGEIRLPLVCRAHATSVLLAIAVGLEHGVEEFEEPLSRACVAAERIKILQVGPIEVIDDSYNANPASMAAALETLADRPCRGARIAALGEMLELGEAAEDLHRRVGARAAAAGVAHLFVRGPHAPAVVQGAQAAHVPHAEVIDDVHAMAEAIHRVARLGDIVLVKGSRGMHMECVIDALRDGY